MNDPHGDDLRRSYESKAAYEADKPRVRRDTILTIVTLVVVFGAMIALAVFR